MELVAKIFETLQISEYALVQFGLVIVLAVVLSATLVKPILAVFHARENLTVKPVAEAKAMLSDVDSRTAGYEQSLKGAASEALARRRGIVEDAARLQRAEVEKVLAEANARLEEMKGRIASEKAAASRTLETEARSLSTAIAEKVLGRSVA
jgi:F0F1-type ATP synthase membrane subunit b/b'